MSNEDIVMSKVKTIRGKDATKIVIRGKGAAKRDPMASMLSTAFFLKNRNLYDKSPYSRKGRKGYDYAE